MADHAIYHKEKLWQIVKGYHLGGGLMCSLTVDKVSP